MEILGQNTIVAYADNIVIIGNSRSEMEMKTTDRIKAVKPIGLKVNQEKTNCNPHCSREQRIIWTGKTV